MDRYKVKRIWAKMKKNMKERTKETIETKENYKKKIRKHKMAAVYRFLLVMYSTRTMYIQIMSTFQKKTSIGW